MPRASSKGVVTQYATTGVQRGGKRQGKGRPIGTNLGKPKKRLRRSKPGETWGGRRIYGEEKPPQGTKNRATQLEQEKANRL